MRPAHTDLEIGYELEPVSYAITQEKINIYSRYVFYGKDTKNIHTDDEVARQAGLPRALAQGRYPIGYISERMFEFFGRGWMQGGKLEVTLVKGIYPGDTLYLPTWEQIRTACPGIRHVIVAAPNPAPYLAYEDVLAASLSTAPQVMVALDDLERIAYTSGTKRGAQHYPQGF